MRPIAQYRVCRRTSPAGGKDAQNHRVPGLYDRSPGGSRLVRRGPRRNSRRERPTARGLRRSFLRGMVPLPGLPIVNSGGPAGGGLTLLRRLNPPAADKPRHSRKAGGPAPFPTASHIRLSTTASTAARTPSTTRDTGRSEAPWAGEKLLVRPARRDRIETGNGCSVAESAAVAPFALDGPDPPQPRSPQERDRIWRAYEDMVTYAAANRRVVTSEDIVAMAQLRAEMAKI